MLEKNDPRLAILVNWIKCAIPERYWSESPLNNQWHQNAVIEKFIEDSDCKLMEACVVNNIDQQVGTELILSNQIDFPDRAIRQIYFVKTIKVVLLDVTDVFLRVKFGSINKNPADSLLDDIHNLYGPSLLSDERWSKGLNPTLKQLLSELETGLTKSRDERTPNQDQHHSLYEASFLTPQEEIRYWSNLGHANNTPKSTTEIATQMEEIFDRFKLLDEFDALPQKSLDDVMHRGDSSLIHKINETLMSLWTELDPEHHYGQNRMARLMSSIANALSHFLQLKLGQIDIWEGRYVDVKNALEMAQEFCYEWTKMTQKLTGYWWAQQNESIYWNGPVHTDITIALLQKRIEQILRIRNSVETVKRNLPMHETTSVDLDREIFRPLHSCNAMHISPYTKNQWDAAVRQFEDMLESFEKRICHSLRTTFSPLSSKPQLLLKEFFRNKELIVRPNVQKELSSERSMLLGQLRSHLSSLRGEQTDLQSFANIVLRSKDRYHFALSQANHLSVSSVKSISASEQQQKSAQQQQQQRQNRNGYALNRSGLTQLVQFIHTAKQIEQKVEQVLQATRTFLNDLPDHQTICGESELFLTELKTFCNEMFTQWQQDLQSEEGGVEWDIGGTSMIAFDANKKLTINYDERLVSLFRDVRQLSILQFRIPQHIVQMAQKAQEFNVYAIALKQIANFYNTVHSQVIRSQSEMIMKQAGEFESVIFAFEREKKKWDRRNSESQIAQLRKAAERFTSVNRKLRKYHQTVADMVVSLIDIDLLREKEQFKDHMRDIRRLFAQVEQEFKHTALWETHWNYQLYKVLEHQYQMGLECINEHLEDYKVDLVFREKRIQFNPPLEKIRQWYFERVKDFVAIPDKFGGINKSTIFRQMIDQNHHFLHAVYRKATTLFAKLARMPKRYTDQVILGTVDIDQLVEESLTDLSHWEINFTMLKEKGKEIDKIESTIRVDCILVSTEQLKIAVEDQLQRLGDALVRSLRQSVQSHLNRIDTFIASSKEKLDSDPQSIDEIGKAHAFCQQLIQEKQSMIAEWDAFGRENKLLKSVASIVVDSSAVSDKWKDLEDTIAAHDIYLKDRTEHLKNDVQVEFAAFQKTIAKFASRWHELKPSDTQFVSKDQALREIGFVSEKRKELDDLREQYDSLLSECAYFGVKPKELRDLDDANDDIKRYEVVWGVYREYCNEIDQMARQDWISFKKQGAFEFEDFLVKWRSRIRDTEKTSVTIHIDDELDEFYRLKDLIKYLQGDGWTANHWASFFHMVGIDTSTTLDRLLFQHLLDHAESIATKEIQIRELNDRAVGEDQIRKSLMDMKVWESATEFTLVEHMDARGVRISLISEWSDILSKIGDFLTELHTLKDSRFADQFTEEISAWERKLADLDEYMQNLNLIQRRWIYLSPVMGRNALPSQQQRFDRIDKDFKNIMNDIESDKRTTQLVKRPLRQTLKNMLNQLNICQKALNDFLEQKREAFARFYFLGDDDLLEILGQAQNPAIIQNHLKKLFAGINSVEFSDNIGDNDYDADNKNDNVKIVAMKSIFGERVRFNNPITVVDKVESWMANLDREMNDTLESQLFQCVSAAEFDLEHYPEQILCLSSAINFTSNCEKAIDNGTLQTLHSQLKHQLSAYTAIEVPGDDVVLEMKIKSLILDLIHHIDIVEQLVKANTSSVEHWTWLKQLRFYIEPCANSAHNEAVFIRMCDACFPYTYEYQGNVSKLVHTPLTDQCYLVLTQGMHNGYGGNPYGPAGTGKTESVKALAHEFGRQCLVFNCDEELDYRSMGRIFIGLVKCGAWGCFDEFNRLKEDQLSAVSQQIQIIQTAIKEKEQHPIQLLGAQVKVNHNAGIFVTMNPAGKGYGGRSKLPDNLKQLFRSVAMSVPDNDLIAESILYAEGFEHAKHLSKKLVSIFILCKQLLSPAQHYDWGLRALKTVLRVSGNLIKKTRRENQQSTITQVLESQMIIKALRVNTLSKLTNDDTQLFNGIVADVFPGIESPDISYEELESAVRAELEARNLLPIDSQIQKIMQFYEATKQRIGVVIVGPSGSGKSVLWTVLRDALRRMGHVLQEYVINPKAMPRTQLMGYMNMDTREWRDGILTASARKVVQNPSHGQTVHHYIIFDGDIDPEWVENLNSVLDDNKLLTMPSGERIQFGNNVNFIFETHSLKYASPATVSRMGMIFLSDEDISAQSIVSAWLNSIPEDLRHTLQSFMESYFFEALNKMKQFSGEYVVETSVVGLIQSGLSHLQEVETKGEFIIGLVRGLGSYLKLQDRLVFSRDIFTMCGEYPRDFQHRPLDYYFLKEENRFEMYVQDSSSETHMESTGYDIEEDKHDNGMPHHSIVYTVQVQRTNDILEIWLSQGHPFILVGPAGSGKHMILQNLFEDMRNAHVATIHCNSRTKALHVTQKLYETCGVFQTNQGKVLRPRNAERLILYLKDLNLAKPDQYGTTQLTSFLQQVLTYQGFYDNGLEWIGMEGVQIVASMNPSTTVGRFPLSPRFSSIVRVCSIDYPTKQQLESIYTQCLKYSFFQRDPKFSTHPIWQQPNNAALLSECMVELYINIRNVFRADDHAHYQFTLRDLTRMVVGLRCYEYTYSEKAGEVIDFWINEARRIFCDRIVINQGQYASIEAAVVKKFDVLQFQSKLDQGVVFTTFFKKNANAKSPHQQQDQISIESAESRSKRKTKKLRPLGSKPLAEIVTEVIRDYAREFRRLRFFITADTMHFVSRVDRVLSQPSGSMLLVGRPGVGRKNTVLLVSHKLGLRLISPNITLTYNVKSFESELKQAMITTGIENDPACLLIEDHHIVSSSFLEHINSLLSAGEVPGLFPEEEQEQLLSPLKEQQLQEGYIGSIYSYFTSRVHKNLRIVLIMDPTNPSFVLNCQSNPAIFSKCYIAWMENWTVQQFVRVPKAVVGSKELERVGDENRQRTLLKLMSSVHESVIPRGATPLQYMQFVDTFRHIFIQKRKAKEEQNSHLSKGLKNLKETSTEVDHLSQEAHQQKILLAQKQKQKAQALEQIRESMQLSVNETNEIEKIRAKISAEEEKVNGRKSIVDQKLSQVQPMLETALHAVQSVSKRDLDEIRSMATPPEGVRDILEGVVKLLGIRDTSWKGIKNTISKLKDNILNFNARNITPAIERSVKDHLAVKDSSFAEKNAVRVSKACAPLAKWVKANIEFSHVMKTVAPLEEQMYALTASQDEMKAQLQQCENKLASLSERINVMQSEFENKTREAEELKLAVQSAETILSKAQDLIGKLSVERDRWEEQLKEGKKMFESLPMYALLASAFLVYLPETTELERDRLLKQWTQLVHPHVEDFDIKTFMSNENAMLWYKATGLPGDDLTIENVIAILEMIQFPLIIDPSQQATQWLKRHIIQHQQKQQVQRQDQSQQDAMEMSNNVEITNLQDPNFINKLELSVRFGKILFIEELDRIEPLLFPLLRGEIMQQGTRKTISIGDKLLDYNDEFRLYLVTRNPNIFLSPDAASLIAQCNFTTTRSSLESQLLSITIQHENPGLEAKKSELLKQEEDDKLRLSELEKQLLTSLANSKGNILENDELIENLNQIKQKSQVIVASLEEASRLKAELDEKREAYRSFARNGSTLFFLISDLANLNHMYQFSLPTFFKLFQRALQDRSDQAANLDARISLLTEKVQRILHRYVGRSIFKQDHLVFSMHMVRGLFGDIISEEQWSFFIGKTMVPNALEKNSICRSIPSSPSPSQDRIPSWVSSDRETACRTLFAALPDVVEQLGLLSDGGEPMWTKWSKSPTNLFHTFPNVTQKKSAAFERLLVIKTFRPDQLHQAMSSFVCSLLRIPSVSPAMVNLRTVYQEVSSPHEPILVITTAGADPTQDLEETAVKEVGRQHFFQLAMGHGQTDEVITLLRKCARNGDWLCLKNCHLATNWLPRLEKEISMLEPHDEFRLWLTTEPSDHFPITLLQQSLKVTFESPPGVKNNLVATYDSWDTEFLSRGNSLLRAQLMFILAWFHAVIQERRSYIPQGWSTFYEFSSADLRSAADVIDAVCKDTSDIDWQIIYGLLENAIYGGRIDNRYDRRVLRTYLKKYFNPSALGTGSSALRGGHTMSPIGNVALPSSMNQSEHLQLIKDGVQDFNTPDMFGLSTNADRLVMMTRNADIVDRLKLLTLHGNALSSLSSSSSSSSSWSSSLHSIDSQSLSGPGDFRRVKWTANLLPIVQYWRKITSDHGQVLFTVPSHNQSALSKSTTSSNDISPVEAFITLEHQNAQSLVKHIDSTLAELSDIVKGTTLLSPSIQSISQDLMNGIAPQAWKDMWNGPSQIQLWLAHVVRKTVAVHSWLQRVRQGKLFNNTIQLKDLFHPDIFLNALKQQTARVTGQPLDNLTKLACQWLPSADARNNNNGLVMAVQQSSLKVRIQGLMLQGCKFDGHSVMDLVSDAPTLVEVPTGDLSWIDPETVQDSDLTNNMLGVPIYFASDRKQFLAELDLPCSEDKSKLILTGLAMFVDSYE